MYQKLIIVGFIFLIYITILTSETVSVSNEHNKSVTLEVVESSDDFTIINLKLNYFTKDTIQINGIDYFSIHLPLQGAKLEKGNPQLPIVAKSVMIPTQSNMKIEMLEFSYKEFDGSVLPSKGNLSRQINPSTIAFEFSNVYKTDEFFPKEIAELGEPYMMREIRGIPFRISPFRVNPVKNIIRYYDNITFKIYTDGINTPLNYNTTITKDFVELYRTHFINYSHFVRRYIPLSQQGSMLVICHGAFMDAMQPFVDWKNQKGIPTTMVDVSLVGGSASILQNYIANYFQTNSNLAYVLLVGDHQQIPSILTSAGSPIVSGGSDPRFGMIIPSTSDNYPDLFISRFSAETVPHVQTQVERTIFYERDILDGDWLNKATGLASNDGYPSYAQGHLGEFDFIHMENIRQLLLGYTYNEVDQFYQANNSFGIPTPSITTIMNAFNDGRGLINYAGHGTEISWDWTNPRNFFTSTNVNQLTNVEKLPHIFSVACVNGRFNGFTCFAEDWLRATDNSSGQPTGAVATYMSSTNQWWVPPMWAQDHANELIVDEEVSTIGGLYFGSSVYMLDIGGTDPYYIDTIRTWNIFGDASLQFRSSTPSHIIVNSQSYIELGNTSFAVSTDAPGSLISLYNPVTKELISSDYANNTGYALLIFPPFDEICTLKLTVTGFNKITNIQDIEVCEIVGIPSFSINPSSHDFGAFYIGQSSQIQTFTITNTGSSSLEIYEIIVTGDNQNDFILNFTTLPWNIPIDGIIDFNLHFLPISPGVKEVSLNINHNASDSPYIATITGTGVELPYITINSYGLLDLKVNQMVTNAYVIFTLSNGVFVEAITSTDFFISEIPLGLEAMTASRISDNEIKIYIIGTPTTHTANSSNMIFPAYIPAINVLNSPIEIIVEGNLTTSAIAKGDGMAVSELQPPYYVWYNQILLNSVTIPVNPGDQIVEYGISEEDNIVAAYWQNESNFFGLTHNTTYHLYVRSEENDNYLAGPYQESGAITTEVIPLLLFTPQHLQLSSIYGEVSEGIQLHVINTSEDDITIINIELSDVTNFHVSHFLDLPYNVEPSDLSTEVMIVSFTPTSGIQQIHEAIITITDNYSRITTIYLFGEELIPIFHIIPEVMNFNTFLINTISPNETFIITNMLSDGLIINSIVLSEIENDHFTLTNYNQPDLVLNHSDYIEFEVNFHPTSHGDKEASIIITHNMGINTVPLFGEGLFLWPIQNFTHEISTEYSVVLRWDPPEIFSNHLSNYNIYRDGLFIVNVQVENNYYQDTQLPSGTYFYEITAEYNSYGESIAMAQTIEIPVLNSIDLDDPYAKTNLQGNYPNPFNPDTNILFYIPSDQHVILEIFNIKGQKITTILEKYMPRGQHHVVWNGKDDQGNNVGNGLYFYRMKASDYVSIKKMILLK